MQISLTPEQQAWLEGEAAAGRIPSIEAAVSAALAELRRAAEVDELSWAKPLCDEARAQFDRGEFITVDEHRARMAKRREILGY